MAAIHSKNTKPEWIVRRGLWSREFRYRLNSPKLPGHPDLVLKSLVYTLNKIWLDDHQAVVSSYPQIVEESEGYLKAAEERKI